MRCVAYKTGALVSGRQQAACLSARAGAAAAASSRTRPFPRRASPSPHRAACLTRTRRRVPPTTKPQRTATAMPAHVAFPFPTPKNASLCAHQLACVVCRRQNASRGHGCSWSAVPASHPRRRHALDLSAPRHPCRSSSFIGACSGHRLAQCTHLLVKSTPQVWFAAAAGRRRSDGTREGVDGIPNTVNPIEISLFYFFFYKIYLATKFWGGMRPYIIHI